MTRLLIVDDHPSIVSNLKRGFEEKGFTVDTAFSLEAARQVLGKQVPDVMMLDIYLGPSQNGLDFLAELRQQPLYRALPILIMTAQPDPDLVSQALKYEQVDFITKSFEDLDELIEKVNRFSAKPAPAGPVSTDYLQKLVGSSDVTIELMKQICLAAKNELHTLITGESGSGKDLVAEVYRQNSPPRRRAKELTVINCARIPEQLFEAELFGHEQGSFTGAHALKKGLVEQADGGILLLNEIGEIPLLLQAKLLDVIEHKKMYRVGSNETLVLDVVILAATHKDLPAMVEQGFFRLDLFQRLKKNIIEVPPLRRRLKDLPELVRYFIKKYNRKNVQDVDPAVIKTFQKKVWKGNVRELEHVMEIAILNCPDQTVRVSDLPKWFEYIPEESEHSPGRTPAASGDLLGLPYREAKEKVLKEFHRDYLLDHLNRHQWNKERTAKAIGILREQLNYLIKRFGLQREP